MIVETIGPYVKKPRASTPHGRNRTTLNTTCRRACEVRAWSRGRPAVFSRTTPRKCRGTGLGLGEDEQRGPEGGGNGNMVYAKTPAR